MEQRLADELKAKDAALKELGVLRKKDLTAASIAHQAAQKSLAKQKVEVAEAMKHLKAAVTAVEVAKGVVKQADMDYENRLKALAGYSKAAQNARGNIGAQQKHRAEAEAALNKYIITNRALLNLR